MATLHDTPLQRAPKTEFREVGDDIFLVHPDGEQMFNLNPTGAALWRMLENPSTPTEIIAVVQTAYPILAPEKVKSDVNSLLEAFLSHGLIITTGTKNKI